MDDNNSFRRRNSGSRSSSPLPSPRAKTGGTPPQSPGTSPSGTPSFDDLLARFQKLRDDAPLSPRQSSTGFDSSALLGQLPDVPKGSISPKSPRSKSPGVGGLDFLDLPSVPKGPLGTRTQSSNFKALETGKSSGSGETALTSPRQMSTVQTAKPKPKFEQDYQRIHTLLQNKEEVMSHFQSLEGSLQKGVRLKDALYQTEQKHGFAPQIHRVDRLQSNEEFMGMVNERVLFKDRGAARDHGENTHRLQWYAVAKDMETHPEHYTTTKASDLYQGLAERYQQGQRSKYHWMSLFDEDRNPGDFREAETLHDHLRKQSTLPFLQAASQAEHSKRRELGPLERYRKGSERNEEIRRMESNSLDPRVSQVQRFKTSDSYQPRVRQEGEQPKSTYVSFQPIKKGGGDK